jgi:hypothetical protein
MPDGGSEVPAMRRWRVGIVGVGSSIALVVVLVFAWTAWGRIEEREFRKEVDIVLGQFAASRGMQGDALGIDRGAFGRIAAICQDVMGSGRSAEEFFFHPWYEERNHWSDAAWRDGSVAFTQALRELHSEVGGGAGILVDSRRGNLVLAHAQRISTVCALYEPRLIPVAARVLLGLSRLWMSASADGNWRLRMHGTESALDTLRLFVEGGHAFGGHELEHLKGELDWFLDEERSLEGVFAEIRDGLALVQALDEDGVLSGDAEDARRFFAGKTEKLKAGPRNTWVTRPFYYRWAGEQVRRLRNTVVFNGEIEVKGEWWDGRDGRLLRQLWSRGTRLRLALAVLAGDTDSEMREPGDGDVVRVVAAGARARVGVFEGEAGNGWVLNIPLPR